MVQKSKSKTHTHTHTSHSNTETKMRWTKGLAVVNDEKSHPHFNKTAAPPPIPPSFQVLFLPFYYILYCSLHFYGKFDPPILAYRINLGKGRGKNPLHLACKKQLGAMLSMNKI